MPTTTLELLRAATRPLHAGLEAVIDLVRPDLTVAAYTRYLARMWAFHAPLEPALRAAPRPDGLDLASLDRAALLARDLAALGIGAEALAAAPRCGRLPALPTANHVLGVAYVVEGSALGGAYVHRHLAATLPDAAARASAFVRPHGDGKATGERWRALVALLESAGPRAGADAVVAGAVDTFAALHAWFTVAPAPPAAEPRAPARGAGG